MLTEPRRQGSTTKSLGLTRASFSIQASQHSTLNTGYSTLNTGSLCLLWVVLLLVAWVLRGALREVVVFGAIPRMSPLLRPPPRHHRRRRRGRNRPPHGEPTPWEIYLAPNLKTRPKYLQHTADPASPPSPALTRPPERRGKQADRSRAEIACPPLLFTVAGEKGKEE